MRSAVRCGVRSHRATDARASTTVTTSQYAGDVARCRRRVLRAGMAFVYASLFQRRSGGW